jgi:hypothetical protein
MNIYIDSEFRCHTTNPDGAFREVFLSENAISFFSNKCTNFIEGFRLKPAGEVWVREDGVKMFGDYIMCAANLSIHPRGSIVESSLGDCIIVDTGGFAAYDATRLDIATTW